MRPPGAEQNTYLARRLMLRRGVTDGALATELGASQRHVGRVIRGECREGALWPRVQGALHGRGCADVVRILSGLPPRVGRLERRPTRPERRPARPVSWEE